MAGQTMAGLRKWFREEQEKLSGMTRARKLTYIWDYYKLWIIGILAGAALVTGLAWRISHNIPDCWLYVVFANTRAEAGNGSALWNEFTEAEGYDLTEKRVEFDDSAYFDYTKNQARGNRYYEVFVALADAGVIDAVTMEPDSLAALGRSGRLLDLHAPICDDIRERWQDRLIWYQPEEGEAIPVGIDVSDSLLITRYHLYEDGCGLGIGVESRNLDNVERFLSFILEEE